MSLRVSECESEFESECESEFEIESVRVSVSVREWV